MLEIKCPVFGDGEVIPKKFTQEGENVSPPLEWSTASDSVEEFALICEDPDAPMSSPYIHWVIYGLDRSQQSLPEHVPTDADLRSPLEAKQGVNSAGEIGYTGPMPPKGHGWHRYYFRLFALDQRLELEPGLSCEELMEKVRGHVIAEARMVGRYQRPLTAPHQEEPADLMQDGRP